MPKFLRDETRGFNTDFNILQIRGIFFHNWPFYYTDKIQNESLSLKMIGLIADWFYFVISLIFILLEPIIVEAII